MKKRSIVMDSFKVGFGLVLGYNVGKLVLGVIDGAIKGAVDGLTSDENKTEEDE